MSSSLIRDLVYVRKIAESLNISLNDEACKVVAYEVEYTLRLIIQNAVKYSKHFNRDTLKLDDVNSAIRDLNIHDTSFGFEGNEVNTYKKEMDFWYLKSKITETYDALTQVIGSLTPDHIPWVRMNWLAVNGIVPKISENSSFTSMKEREILKHANDAVESKDINLKSILIKEVSDNLLSKVQEIDTINIKELQICLNDMIEAIKSEEKVIDNIPLGRPYKISPGFKKVLQVLRENQGLNNIIPFLTNYIYLQHDIVNVNGIAKKINLAKVMLAYSFNLNFNLESYLHILIKILLTFITSNKLSLNDRNNEVLQELHIRDLSAKALVSIITRYEEKYYNLKYNVANTLVGIFEKEPSNYSTLYGIIRVFYYFDANIIKDFFLKKLSNSLQISTLLADAYRLDKKEVDRKKINPIVEITDINNIMAHHVYTVLLELCSRVLASIPVYSSKSYYESHRLYMMISDIFGEACLLCPSSKAKLRTGNQIMPLEDKRKSDRYAYLNYMI